MLSFVAGFILGCFAKKIWRFSWKKIQDWLKNNS